MAIMQPPSSVRSSEIIPACLIAGTGMVFAGSLVDKIKFNYADEFDPYLLSIIPPLIGLKGNLEVTLSSRLATVANLKTDVSCQTFQLFFITLLYILLQGVCAAVTISALCWSLHDPVLTASKQISLMHLSTVSLLTCAIAICALSFLVFLVIIGCQKFGVDPDNIAPPVAAALGDLGTVAVLVLVNRFAQRLPGSASWLAVILLALVVGASLYYLGCNPALCGNELRSLSITPHTLFSSIAPLLTAVAMSSLSGQILARFSHIPNLARLQLVINGVGGCFGSIVVSRMLTAIHARHLHGKSYSSLIRKSSTESAQSSSGSQQQQPERSTAAPNERALAEIEYEADTVSRLILFSSVPIHFLLSLISYGLLLVSGDASSHGTTRLLFTSRTTVAYVLAGFLQVLVLLRFAKWIVLSSWQRVFSNTRHLSWLSFLSSPRVVEPSLAALDLTGIALTTGLGDLVGSVLLTITLFLIQ